MGQSMKKLARKDDHEQKRKDIIDNLMASLDAKIKENKDQIISVGAFYHEIFTAVQKMNESESGFQLNCPTKEELEHAFNIDETRHDDDAKYHTNTNRELTKDEFKEIMKEFFEKFLKDLASKKIRDILLYIYGFPISATLMKQAVFPEIVSDDVFIPLVTAASVFIFAKTKTL